MSSLHGYSRFRAVCKSGKDAKTLVEVADFPGLNAEAINIEVAFLEGGTWLIDAEFSDYDIENLRKLDENLKPIKFLSPCKVEMTSTIEYSYPEIRVWEGTTDKELIRMPDESDDEEPTERAKWWNDLSNTSIKTYSFEEFLEIPDELL